MSHDHSSSARNSSSNSNKPGPKRHRLADEQRPANKQHRDLPQPGSVRPKSLRERMSQDLRLRGLAPRTHDGYLREVRKLACYYNTPPGQLSEQQVTDYSHPLPYLDSG